ncbi:MAG: hypothetical protein NVV74_23745 [Magnetospirillum sp.]|nr:hypothetical protein [Magnetospirillum sp.]
MKEILYIFRFADGREEQVRLGFDERMLLEDHAERPWTALAAHRCGHCPLPETADHCPFATGLAPFAERFAAFASYDRVQVVARSPQRDVVAERALQHGLASLIGLVGATSGCPHLAFFRPMARFHLPFSSEEETLVRAFALHLLGDWINGRTLAIDDLAANYRAAAEVNRAMAERMRAAFPGDAVVNALVSLDTYAQAVPYVVGEKLAELAYIFAED